MNIKRVDIKDFIATDGLTIDVRSPDEYCKGHMPNSINIPLFNNFERSVIGKKYKVSGKNPAVLEGLAIIDDKLNKLIDDLILAIDKDISSNQVGDKTRRNIKIYCARGGMRSKSVSWLLKKINIDSVTLKGGYKSYRNHVLNSFNLKHKIILIGGKTGTGKTRILKLLRCYGNHIIDLESLANHRGSSFGGLGMKSQPSNEQFENLIADELNYSINKEIIYLEAESANIGKCRIPIEFYKQMKDAQRIEILNNQRNRLTELIKTYSIYDGNDLKEAVERIAKRLGPQRTKKAKDSINSKNWEGVCEAVLDYYDKCYDHELNSIEREIRYLDISDISDELLVLSINNMMK